MDAFDCDGKTDSRSNTANIAILALSCITGFFTFLVGTIASPFLFLGSGVARAIELIQGKINGEEVQEPGDFSKFFCNSIIKLKDMLGLNNQSSTTNET